MSDEDDKTLFRRSIGPVRRLRAAPGVDGARRRPRPVPRQRLADEAQVLREMAEDLPILSDSLETGDELRFAREGVTHAMMRRLRRGYYVVEAELDLHGLTAPEAREALLGFLARCRHRGVRCVRIIHGKGLKSPGGRPVLKAHLNRWLPRCNEVLAFCSAPPGDGGTGAAYVLLRRPVANR